MGSRRTEIECHLREEETDEMSREAEEDRDLRRIGFVKNFYQGDTIPEAAGQKTGTRAGSNNSCRVLGTAAPKLDEQRQTDLVEMLRGGQPWTFQEIQRLLEAGFGVEYDPNYLGAVLRNLGL